MIVDFPLQQDIGLDSLAGPVPPVSPKCTLGWQLIANRYIVKLEKRTTIFSLILLLPQN